MTAVDLVLEEARRWVGTTENPKNSNRGIEVDYWAFLTIGDKRWSIATPWCASFIYAVGVQALGRHGWPLPRTASCQALYEAGLANRLLRNEPEPGDVFVLYYQSKGRYGHTGFVSSINLDSFGTIEGNTGPEGSREGYGVFERERPINDVRAVFIRWTQR